MIDVHAHLGYRDFDRDIEEIIEKARQEIAGIIVSSARYSEGLKTLDLVRDHPGFLFPTLGYHPTEGDGPEKVIELIMENKDLVVGIGEVGLDYHWEKDPTKRVKQKKVFQRFIDLAKELDKPLVIHSWDAEEDCFEMVRDSDLTVIFHCFSGKKPLAQDIVDVPNFYISISTQVLFNKNLRKVVKGIPLERMLLETDAPFLNPFKDSKKEKRNMPWNILVSAEKIAKIRHIDAAEVLNAARENAITAFGLRLE